MTKEEIKKGNKLIAEFIGLYVETDDIGRYKYYTKTIVDKRMVINYHYPQYDSSWDWLMPVLEKIFRLKIGDGIKYVEYSYARTFGMLSREDGQIMVRLDGSQLQKADTLIEATYLAVINFITWYNGQKINRETNS
jgi:hypothetical protein